MLNEEQILRAIIDGNAHARAEFSQLYLDRMLAIWSRRRPKNIDEDLDRDFVHWFLYDWISRPNDTHGYLSKFLDKHGAGKEIKFLKWWAATARHRFTDFYREMIRSRFEQRSLGSAEEDRELVRREAVADPERLIFLAEAVAVLDECFADADCVALLKRLGFELRDGELVSRRGRVSERERGTAAAIGRRLTARGYTPEEVRRALPGFLARLQKAA
jgi:hypothetical protein